MKLVLFKLICSENFFELQLQPLTKRECCSFLSTPTCTMFGPNHLMATLMPLIKVVLKKSVASEHNPASDYISYKNIAVAVKMYGNIISRRWGQLSCAK